MESEQTKDTPSMSDQVDFSHRVLVVWMKGPAKGGVVENASLCKIADRTFLSCQAPSTVTENLIHMWVFLAGLHLTKSR